MTVSGPRSAARRLVPPDPQRPRLRPRAGAVPALLAVLALGLAACSSSAATSAPGGGSPAASPVASSGSGGTLASCPKSQPAPLPAGQSRTVTITTPKGTIVIKVDGSLSPIAAGNFVALAQCGYYDNVVFHRVVAGFVIQGGDGQFGRAPNVDPNQVGTGGPGYTIQDEPVTATYARGVVAMARTSQPNSQGSQFFIVLADSAQQALASVNTYAIFGHVTSGMDAVDAIAAAANGVQIPSDPVPMTKVTVGP